MKNPGFADRLNHCLDKEGFPPKNRGRIQLLAEMVGLTHRGASKWINGEGSPPAKKFASLAKKLNVSETWLRTGEGAIQDDQATCHPAPKTVSQEVNLYSIDSLLSAKKIILDTITCALPYKGHFFGITLDTEAMAPRFPKGSIIIFDESIAKDGDFVLVDFNEFPVPIFRQLLVMGQTLYLNAHNPKFDRLILTDSSRIVGKLVQAILSFD
ncbi:MAG: S24 family peptidase [Tatlockia sp.]|jgi:transcriptional regulator with XRE-family HTH domain